MLTPEQKAIVEDYHNAETAMTKAYEAYTEARDACNHAESVYNAMVNETLIHADVYLNELNSKRSEERWKARDALKAKQEVDENAHW
jgi:lysyl-tRNA synthetase class II